MSGNKVIAFIFARGGSKGIPHKNVTLLGGIPLIAHSIIQAKKHPLISKVIVSTDDQQIADVSYQYGAEIPFIRPKELALDNSPEWLAWQHAIRFCIEKLDMKDFSTFISLPATSPLRAQEDITSCLERFRCNDVDIVVTGSEASRNPYFNMAKINSFGRAELVMSGRYERRQDAPKIFDLTTVAYVSTPEFILSSNNLWDGSVALVPIPKERAIDIDEPLDLLIAECLYQKRNLDMSFSS